MKIKYQIKKKPKLKKDYSILIKTPEEGDEFDKLARCLGKYWHPNKREDIPDHKQYLKESPEGVYYCLYTENAKYYFRLFKTNYADEKEQITLEEFKKRLYED